MSLPLFCLILACHSPGACLVGCAGTETVPLTCDPDATSSDPGPPAIQFSGERPENLLLISVDTLRRDRVGRYDGSDRTDFLDSLFAQGVALDDHRSCSNWTYPAMLCVLTGQGVLELGFIPPTNLGDDAASVPEEIEFLGDWLGESGYSTHLITANTLIGEKFGFNRAYQTWLEVANQPADAVNSQATALFSELRKETQPWFVHLHYLDPHIPYEPPAEYLSELKNLAPIDKDINMKGSWVEVYDDLDHYSQEEIDLYLDYLRIYYNGELAYLDDQLSALFNTLEAWSLLDNTLVVLVSDHGEQFLEHDQILHHSGLYQEESNAVALFWSPTIQPVVWTAPTSHPDLVPTLFDALGISPPTGLSGSVVGTQPEVCARFAHTIDEESGAQSVDYQDLRMVYLWEGEAHLFDRVQDPREQEDLVEARPEDAILLWSFLAPKVEALDALHPDAKPKDPNL